MGLSKKTVDTSSCRVVFGEADFLPGLVVDKFSDVLAFQALSFGMDRRKKMVMGLLKRGAGRRNLHPGHL